MRLVSENTDRLLRDDEPQAQEQPTTVVKTDEPARNKSKDAPVIGILTTNRMPMGRIRPCGVQGELSYLSRMGRRINGSVYVFHPWDIDWKNHRFTGYRFHPEDDGFGRWERCSMPPPDVVYDQIYNRVAERKYLLARTRLKKLTKGRYFNPCYLNKLTVHRNLSKLEEMRPHMPETRLLRKPEDLRAMISSYKSLYIKPVGGSLGRGIIRITRESGRFVYKTRGGRVGHALSVADLYRKIKRITGKKTYIVQQGIDLILFQGRVVDIRSLMQKNGQGEWSITKVYARVGPQGNITSNLASGGTAHPLKKVISASFNPEQVEAIREQIRKLSVKVCEAVEITSGEIFGEMGVDLGLDKKGRLWVIEVNSKPRRTTGGKGSRRLITLSFSKPLRFAAHLVQNGKSRDHSRSQRG